MSKRRKSIEDFFAAYELHFNNSISGGQNDVTDPVRRSFEDCFAYIASDEKKRLKKAD